ncbi:MAG: hypothetical protein Q9M17_03340 [Mariprofundus sp.]|nr:hypothetical protein [Mariprofundus sp.]
MKFYNESLYPKLEAREMSAFGLVPSGSLLEWIDEMFTPPVTKFDRTLGNWTNVRDVYHHFPPELNRQMHFRVFGTKAGMPRKHGEFNDISKCFWQDSYLKTYRESGRVEKTWKSHYEACRERLKADGLLRDDEAFNSPTHLSYSVSCYQYNGGK